MISHARIVFGIDVRVGVFEVFEQVDKIRVVQLKPLWDRCRRTPTAFGQRTHNPRSQVRVEDLANTDHRPILVSGKTLQEEINYRSRMLLGFVYTGWQAIHVCDLRTQSR